jgi:hypothetical protein
VKGLPLRTRQPEPPTIRQYLFGAGEGGFQHELADGDVRTCRRGSEDLLRGICQPNFERFVRDFYMCQERLRCEEGG